MLIMHLLIINAAQHTASLTPYPALCAGGALGERWGFHAADPPPLRSRLTRRVAAELRWAGQATPLPK